MNLNLELLKLLSRLFNALDALVQNYGVYFYLAFVWLSLALIAWVLSGGLRRKQSQENLIAFDPGIIITTRPMWHQRRRQSSSPRFTKHRTVTTKRRIKHDNFSLATIKPWPTCRP
jgi:hypothetical protein